MAARFLNSCRRYQFCKPAAGLFQARISADKVQHGYVKLSTDSSARNPEYQEQYTIFDTNAYLKLRFSRVDNNTFRTFPLKHLHSLYTKLGSVNSQLSVLDVGSGPSISYAISAIPFAKEIVLSEYVEDNRIALLQWMNNEKNSFDWSVFLRHVIVDIGGGKESDIESMKAKLRSVMKVIPCDAGADPLLPPKFIKQYDVIQSCLCLECIGPTKKDYVETVTRVVKLLKPGGKIALYHAETNPKLPGPARYPVGDKWMKFFRFGEETVFETLTQLGFTDITRESTSLPPELVFDADDPITPAFYTATYAGSQ